MTDEVVTPKNDLTETICDFMQELRTCGKKDFHLTSSADEADNNPQLISGLISKEDTDLIVDAFTEIFPEETLFVDKTAIDVIYYEELAYGKVALQKLHMQVYCRNNVVSLSLFCCPSFDTHFRSKVFHQKGKQEPFQISEIPNYPYPKIFLLGIQTMGHYFEEYSC
jgi:hypothetical protein